MGSFPEVRPKDADTQRTWDFRHPVFRDFLGSAALCHRRALVPAPENSRVVERHWEVCPIYPSVPFPENHHHQNQVQPIRLPYGDGRSNGRCSPNTVSQLTRNNLPLHAKGSDDRCRGF